jgi:glutaredoxin
MRKFTGLLLFALTAPLLIASSAFCQTQPAGAKIDLSKGLSFEKYITTGTGLQLENALDRLTSLAPSEFFLSAVKAIDTPFVIAAFTDITCPDCARTIPFVQTIQNVNPLGAAVYFLRNDETRAFLKTQTGRAAVPTLFITDKNGTVAGGVYVEYPESVQAMIDASSSDEEASRRRGDFREGQYDEEVQKDMLKLIESALPELKGR